MTSVVQFHDVCLRRESTWLLRNISWSVPAASDVAILGPNGSGKSTIARILLGYLWPTSGSVGVLGEQFGETDLHELRRQIRLVQPNSQFDLDPGLSLLEVVLTGYKSMLVLRTEPTEQEAIQAKLMLKRVGLESLMDRKYRHASSGERVRALIGRSMVTAPKLLILDEPTAGLDLLGREQLLQLIGSLRQTMHIPELSIVTITHHVEELFSGTSEVLLLKQGSVFASGRIEEVLTSKNMSEVYDFPIRVHQEAGRYYALVSKQ